MRNPIAFEDERSFGVGNEYFVRLAGYANPHLTYEFEPSGYSILKYDGRFKTTSELFESEGNIDVKVAASIIWAAKRLKIKRVYSVPAGAIFEVVD